MTLSARCSVGGGLYGSDLLAEALVHLGIRYVACNPGSTTRGLHDSIVNHLANKELEMVLFTHEEAAVAAAHGYAKATGKPMAVLVHDVVGLMHASMAIYNAWCDRVPVLILGGAAPADASRRRPWIDWIHSALVQGQLVRDYVKWDDQPASLEAAIESLARAYAIAVTPPEGPVYVCFDVTIQEAPVTGRYQLSRLPLPRRVFPEVSTRTVSEVAELLRRARFPVVVADRVGQDPVSFRLLQRLAELVPAAVVDLGGRFNFPNDHPLDATDFKELALEEADVILALDVADLGLLRRSLDANSPPARPGAAASEKVVILASLDDYLVRGWTGAHQKLPPASLQLLTYSRPLLEGLVSYFEDGFGAWNGGQDPSGVASEREKAEFFHRLESLRQVGRARWQAEIRERWDETPVAPCRLAAEIWKVLQGRRWVLVNGTLDGWARRLWSWSEPRQFLGGSGGGGMGYGIGASVGAALAYRSEDVICVDLQPDGDLLYVPGALWTAANMRLPLLVVMFNNRSYYNDEVHQLEVALHRGRPEERRGIGTRLENPPVDFAMLARSMGVYGEGPICSPDELQPALERAVRVVASERKPALVDVVTAPR